MFESIEQPLEADIEFAALARTVLNFYLYIAFTIQTLTFALIFYLIHFRTPAAMSEYRRLLQVNIISAYFTEVAFILWIPIALPTNYHILSDGLIGKFGPKAQYYWFFIVFTLVCSHVIAIIACVLYQVKTKSSFNF